MDRKITVEKTGLPAASQLKALYQEDDFLDCYSVGIGQADISVQDIAQRLFQDPPGWMRNLLAIRDFAVSFFGLKTTSSLPKNNSYRPALSVGDYVSFFKILSIEDNEIILGEDDAHLNFKVSISRTETAPERVSLATWVRPHNRLGRIYLGIIKPFHILIVKTCLANAAKHFR